MKTIKTNIRKWAFLLGVMPTMLLSSCADVDDGSHVDPILLTEKIGGNWVLNDITQVDETSGTEMGLGNLLGFETFGLNLSKDGQFSVSGTAPKLLPVSGTWELDNNFVKSTGDATKIILKGNAGNVTLTVTNTPGAVPDLNFQLTRYAQGQPFVSYKYNLSPVK